MTETLNKAGEFAKDGFREAARLSSKTLAYGARATAKQELEVEKEFVENADGALDTLRRAGQSGGQLVGVMLTITLAAAIGFVGIKVSSEIEDSVHDRDIHSVNAENRTVYENGSVSISDGFADAMGLSDLVFLVLMFGVILGALLAFRSSQ